MKRNPSPSLGRPLRVTVFRNLLIADVVSDAGAFMQNVGAGMVDGLTRRRSDLFLGGVHLVPVIRWCTELGAILRLEFPNHSHPNLFVNLNCQIQRARGTQPGVFELPRLA